MNVRVCRYRVCIEVAGRHIEPFLYVDPGKTRFGSHYKSSMSVMEIWTNPIYAEQYFIYNLYQASETPSVPPPFEFNIFSFFLSSSCIYPHSI